MPANALASKILCQRHNEALSPLDETGGHLYETLRKFDAGLAPAIRKPSKDRVAINGADLERWLLKVTAGLLHGKVLTSPSIRPDFDWLPILFGLEPWPDGWGLVLPTSGDSPRYAFPGFGATTAVNEEDGTIWGVSFNIAGFEFILRFTPGPSEHPYRPAGISFHREDARFEKKLAFVWPHGAQSPWSRATSIGTYNGERPFRQ